MTPAQCRAARQYLGGAKPGWLAPQADPSGQDVPVGDGARRIFAALETAGFRLVNDRGSD